MSTKSSSYLITCCVVLLLNTGRVSSQNMDIDILRSINPQNPQASFWKGVSDSYIIVSGTATFGTLAFGILKKDK